MILVYDEYDGVMLEGDNHYAFSKSLRNKIESRSAREKMPAKWFLDPKNRKFPYVNPDTKKPDCRLIKAAMVRSGGGNKAHKKFPQIHAKAVALWNKYCSKKKKESFDADIDYALTDPMLEDFDLDLDDVSFESDFDFDDLNLESDFDDGLNFESDLDLDLMESDMLLGSNDAYYSALDVKMEALDRLERKIDTYFAFLEGEYKPKGDAFLESDIDIDDVVDDTALLESELDMLDAEITLMEMETSPQGEVLL
ncbi:MAG: hypothetical protein GXO10_06590 [Crenarchaeota archaeon]|nr:hypothetical protein [Thermoproteota archaeon]